jgi:prepilin-type processing-associated H-X9-DG protein
MPPGNYLIDDEVGKKAETPLSMKKVAILALLLFLLSVMSVICYSFSIGINLWVDALAQLVPVCGTLAFLAWVWACFLFVYCLFKRRFARAFGFLAVSLVFLFTVAVIIPATGRLPNSYFREECTKKMEKIGVALKAYAKDHNDMLPAEDWCDILIMDYKLDTRDLFCHFFYSRFREGESSYALNVHIMTTKLSDLPSNTVIAFETDFVGENPGRMISLWDRKCMKKHNEPIDTKQNVRESAWNQVGDISLVSCEHHAGLGCNILFADGHVEFVRKKDIPNLRWKP